MSHLYNTRLLILWHLSDTLRPYFARDSAESLDLWEKVFQKVCVTGLTLSGSGKTRTVIALCKVLLDAGWVKNILFLADRNSLVTQAKRSFVNILPDLSCTNLCEEKDNYNSHCVFSTYQTMMGCIDSVKDEAGKLFTSGHFDLVICDEYDIIGLSQEAA